MQCFSAMLLSFGAREAGCSGEVAALHSDHLKTDLTVAHLTIVDLYLHCHESIHSPIKLGLCWFWG